MKIPSGVNGIISSRHDLIRGLAMIGNHFFVTRNFINCCFTFKYKDTQIGPSLLTYLILQEHYLIHLGIQKFRHRECIAHLTRRDMVRESSREILKRNKEQEKKGDCGS
jgi:hypothetical protein